MPTLLELYAIGVLVTPRNPAVDLHLRNQMTVEELRAELEESVHSVRRELPKEMLAKVISSQETILSILSLLPRIVDANIGDYNIYMIRQTTLEYLPGALLGEQFHLLDTSMKKIVEDFHRHDTRKILIHGRFLEAKFHKGDILGRSP